ncbi:MAG: HRDC domain-containing protein [Thermoguttaceae bacterium]|nr:HRDC domain-containing protein [Thermoguttaceae bacterium]
MPRPFELITEPSQLAYWCQRFANTEWIGIDTEFIAERYYRPLLCLVQAATPEGLFIIDPISRRLNLTHFWEIVANGPHETIVHAGRLELEFCWWHTGKFPKNVFDTQLAAGMVLNEYPAGYGTVVSELLGIQPPGTESRSNWKSRPLTDRQFEYAVDDIKYLHPVRDILYKKLEGTGRLGWFQDEIQSWRSSIYQLLSPERWQRILNGSHWDSHELAIVHALWNWRDHIAQARNCTSRHVLRDDLILELARRKIADVRSIRNIRGMERSDLQNHLEDISNCISTALQLPESQCPPPRKPPHYAKLAVLGSLLYSVLGTICHQNGLASALVGTPSDVREWVAWRLGFLEGTDEVPALATGWRAEIIGKTFDALLSGEKMIHITDPKDPFPIEFV